MPHMDPDIEALRRLVGTSVERRLEVADRLGANEQTIYQIIRGVPLKSGKPRGIGRKLREALDTHFPGWRAASQLGELPASYSAQPAQPHAALADLLRSLAELPAGRWAMVRARMDAVVGHPEDASAAAEDILSILRSVSTSSSGKRNGTDG